MLNKWLIIILITIVTLLIIACIYIQRNHVSNYTTTTNDSSTGFARDFINAINPSTYKSIISNTPRISKAWKGKLSTDADLEKYVVNDEKSMDEYAKKKLTANEYAKFKNMSVSGKHIYLSHI